MQKPSHLSYIFRLFPFAFYALCSFSAQANSVYSMSDLTLDENKPISLEADKITYDDNSKTVVASGNVVIEQEDTILKCDSVSYNTQNNLISASGNVSLLSPSGTVVFTEEMEVNDSLTEGKATGVKITLADKSRMNAEEVTYNEGKTSTLTKGSYSPCDICEGEDALWTIHADKVEKDDEEQIYRYYDAWIDFKGVPILYTPYFSHADPKIKRKTGFLFPGFGTDSELGFEVTTPFFWAIDENQNFTFTPRFMTKEGVLLQGKYEGLFDKGFLNIGGAFTFTDKKKDFRGYFTSDFEYDFNKHWRLTGDLNYVSDDTFIKKYDLSDYNEPWLENTIALEGFGKKSYFKLYGTMFEERRDDVPNDFSPKVIPAMTYSYMGSPTEKYGYFTFDSYAGVIRRSGHDVPSLAKGVEKLNTEFGWHLPYTDPLGSIYKIDATLRADGYSVHDYFVSSKGKEWSGATGRLFPQLSVEWRYPFIKTEESSYQVIEPIASLVIAPNGCNPEEIPNEDSLDFNFDETNLFSANRFAGYDRVESGARINYGLQWSIYGNESGKISALFGQSYRLNKSSAFSENSGLYDRSSDYVGKLELALPQHGFFINYRFRLDHGDFAPQRNEVDFNFNFDWLKLSGYYMNTKEIITEYSTLPRRREIGLYASAKLNQYWSLGGYWQYDLIGRGQPIEWGGSLSYEDECFGVTASVKREYTSDRDYKGGTSFLLLFNFKTLGMVKATEM